MADLKKIILIVLIAALPLISAISPPSIPFFVFGKVYFENGVIVQGAQVNLIYNQGGNDILIKTKTYTLEEAKSMGDISLAGSYKFRIDNSYDVRSIRIECRGKSVEVIGEEGLRVTAPDLVLSISETKNKGQGATDFSKSLIGKLAGLVNGLLKQDFIKHTSDSNSNYSSKKNLESGNFSSPDSELNYSGNSSDSGNDHGNYAKNQQNPGKLAGAEENNSSSEGEEGSPDTSLQPQESSFSQGNKIEAYSGELNFSEEKQDKKAVFGGLQENIFSASKDNKPIFYASVSILAALFLFILVLIFQKLNIKTKKTIYNLEEVKSKEFISNKLVYLDPSSSVQEALDTFQSSNVNIIPVVISGRAIGIISKKDLLEKYLKVLDAASFTRLGLESVMNKKFVSCNPLTRTGDMYTIMLEKKINGMVIEDNGKIKGVIDFFDILKFFSDFNFKFENPPALKESMGKEVIFIDSKARIVDLAKYLIKKDSEYSIVIENKKPIGIVTLKDLLMAINKDYDFRLTKVKNIMSGNLVSMTPGTSIYNAFDVMMQRRFNQIPVIMENKIVGIVNVRFIVKSFYELLSDLKNKKLKYEIVE
jgi:predicted transcriptional regulator